MKRINIDIETFSSVDLNQTGVYKYAESLDFEVMLFGYSVDRGPKIVIDLTRGEKIPQEILDALEDPEIEKYAYNASFERVCLSHYLAQQGKDYGTGHYLDPNGWHCTRVQGATWGLPLSLAECGRVLDISDKKLDAGKELISYFCKPCAPTASNGGITRHMPVYDERDESVAEEEVLMLLNDAEAKGEKPKLTDMQKWTLFKYYNKRDVIAEEEIGIILDKREELLAAQKITLQPGEDPDFHKKNNEFEYKAYVLDQKINDRGVRIDIDLAEKAIDASKQFEKDAKSIIIDITGVTNPGSNVQMLEWLNANGVYNPVTIGTLVQALAEVKDRSPLEDNYYQKIVRAIQANVGNKDRYLDFNNIDKLLSDESTHPEIKELFKLKSLAKDVMADLLSDKYLKLLPEDVQEVLQLKKQISKTSVKKYETMIKCACSDGRARGLFQFYGAPKTGRFAGRLIQLQNMSKNKDDDDKTAEVRKLLKEKGYDGLLTLDKPVPEILSELVRTAIVPDKGYKFADADYSAIEARVLAWLANETWRLKAFADGQDIYCASASQMFGVPVEKHGQNANLRQKGKVAELACGYGGGVGALKAFGADKMGLTETEMQEIINSWRKASPSIKNYWYKIDSALKDVTDDAELEGSDKPTGSKHEGRIERVHTFKLIDERGDSVLIMRLPSGRCLAYPNMREDPKYGLVYDGIRNGKWDFNKIYGALGVENITQATARDLLVAAMLKLEEKEYHTIMHIHDEVVVEIPEDGSIEQLQEICNIMGTLPEWANKGGLLTPAEGYVADFFLKSDKCDAKSQLNIEAEATLEATEEQEFEQMFS